MTRPPLPTLQDLRDEADRLGIRWQAFGVCRRKLSDKIEAELKRRNDRDDREEAWHRRQDELRKTTAGRRQIAEELERAKVTIASWESAPDRGIHEHRTRTQRKRRSVEREEAIGEWIKIVHGVEPDEGAPEVADKIARMGEQIETLRESEAAKDRQIEDLRELEVVKDRRIEALGQVVRGGERQLSELKAQIAGQEGQLRELVSEMFHLEHARDVARKHAQERGRAMYSGPRKQLDRLGEVERRLDRIEDDDAATGHKFRAAGSAVRAMLDRRDRGK
jgi:hypothetical protein